MLLFEKWATEVGTATCWPIVLSSFDAFLIIMWSDNIYKFKRTFLFQFANPVKHLTMDDDDESSSDTGWSVLL